MIHWYLNAISDDISAVQKWILLVLLLFDMKDDAYI